MPRIVPILGSEDHEIEAYLQALVDDKEYESKTLDYKEVWALSSDREERRKQKEEWNKEFRFDVTSFANASGGDIILGISDNSGEPKSLVGFDLGTESKERHEGRLRDLLQTHIKPRIIGVEIRTIVLQKGIGAGKGACIIRIPRSLSRPHQVEAASTDFQFWFRHGTSKHRMDIDELRSEILLSETLTDRVRRFRQTQLETIKANRTPVQLEIAARMVLHMLPLRAFEINSSIDLSKFNRPSLMSLSGETDVAHRNFDGYLSAMKFPHENVPHDYVQLYQTGIVEAVDTYHLRESAAGQKVIAGGVFEKNFREAISSYLNLLKQLGVEVPLVLMLSLINVRGYTISTGPGREVRQSIDREDLWLPEVMIEDYSLDLDIVLKRQFDMIWNSVGIEKSPHFDKLGKWIG